MAESNSVTKLWRLKAFDYVTWTLCLTLQVLGVIFLSRWILQYGISNDLQWLSLIVIAILLTNYKLRFPPRTYYMEGPIPERTVERIEK